MTVIILTLPEGLFDDLAGEESGRLLESTLQAVPLTLEIIGGVSAVVTLIDSKSVRSAIRRAVRGLQRSTPPPAASYTLEVRGPRGHVSVELDDRLADSTIDELLRTAWGDAPEEI